MAGHDPYRRMAHLYDRLIEPMQSGVRRIALDLVPPDPAWDVLDVGCGTGTGLAGYADAGCAVVGIDVSAAMLERASERLGHRAELHLVSPGPMPFEDDRFDLAITSMVIHELPAEGRIPLVRETARVVKPGGRLLVIDFRFGSLRGWRGRALRLILPIIERFSGHYRQYRSFRIAGGVPPLLAAADLELEREKIVAGGNLAVYVIGKTPN